MNKPGVFVLYSIPAPADWLETKWSAGECLTYVGGFVAALAAVVGVYATISESRLSEERQLRESVAPCIALTLLKNGTLAEDEQDDEESAFPKISLNQEPYCKACRHLANTPLLENHVAISAVSATASVIFQSMCLQNVGRGAAVNLCSGVNEPDTDYRHTSFKMLAPGEEFYIGLYVDTDSDEVFGEYELRLTFYDSLGYRYEELFPVFGQAVWSAGRWKGVRCHAYCCRTSLD
ncbi:MAG: hypothetical protein UC368_06055 [Eggerthellaceae bacterium]|nr:hypothetical protein [Eggerthellaceae bacterium]